MYLLIFLFIRHTIHVFISFKWLLKLRSIQVKSKAWYYNICFTIFCRSTSDLPKLLKDMLKEHCRQQDGKQHLCTCVQYRINSPSYVTRYVHAAVNTSTISQAGAYLCCNRPSFYKNHDAIVMRAVRNAKSETQKSKFPEFKESMSSYTSCVLYQ